MLRNIIEAERQQDADCARIEAAVRIAEERIVALRARLLDEGDARERWCTIRDQTVLAVREVRHNVIKRANEAKDTKTWLNLVQARGNGVVSNGSVPEELAQLAVEERLASICRSAERADARITELFFNRGRG
jgi:hypothetical protein